VEGPPSGIPVRLQRTADITKLETEQVGLLIIGGPARRQKTTARLQAALGPTPRGSLSGVKADGFDARYRMAACLSGSAAQRVARLVKKLGARFIAPPESFLIEWDVPP
jgi:hypothetical protein